jgi:hypothetical protein
MTTDATPSTSTAATEPTVWRSTADRLGRMHKAAENIILLMVHEHPGMDAIEHRDLNGMPTSQSRMWSHLEDKGYIVFKKVDGHDGWWTTSKAQSILMEITPR